MMAGALPCFDDETLARYCEGLAAPHEARAVDAHAATCPRCSQLLASVMHLGSRASTRAGAASRGSRPLTAAERIVVAERYRLDHVIGMGGMGTVYAATRLADGARVALKTLHADTSDFEVSQRLRREARILASLQSTHIVKILDSGDLPSGQPFLAMELLDGCSVLDMLHAVGPLTADVVAQVMRDSCEALAQAHACGIVHRDVKPANLFFARTPQGSVLKVLDFGLGTVPVLPQDAETAMATRMGALLGTPHYMAPEQIREASAVDARTDIFSLGAAAYTLLTNAMPFAGTNTAVLLADVLTGNPTPIAQLAPATSPALCAIVERCMQKDPAARYASCAELAAALSTLAGAPEPPARGPSGKAAAYWSAAIGGGLAVGAAAHYAAALWAR